MKMVDVVKQLQVLLPRYTNLFSNIFEINSITTLNGVATIQTNVAHELVVDGSEAVTVAGVSVKTAIDSVSQDGLVFTFTTTNDHDLTEGWEEHENVTFDGFTDVDWNDSFKLVGVPNRKTFKVQSDNSLPTLNGNEVLFENRTDGVNGRYTPTVVDSKTFTVEGDFIDGTYTGGTVGSAVRVAGVVDADSIEEWYTKNALNDFWMFVLMNDAVISKDRHALSDASGTMATGQDIRMRLVDGFNLIIVKNTSEDMSAIEAIDICRDTLLLPVLKSVFGAKFTTGLSNAPDFKTILTGHGIAKFNRAVLQYSYSFEVPMDLTDDDTVEPENTRAFRDIDMTQEIGGDDTTDMTVIVDLDENPL